MTRHYSRRAFISACAAVGITNPRFADALAEGPITAATVACAEEVSGITLTDGQREQLVEDLQQNLDAYTALRELDLPNSAPPALTFDPRQAGVQIPTGNRPMRWEPVPTERPSSDEDLAFLSVAGLAYLLRSRQVTSTELTTLFLSRLNQYSELEAVVTLTEDLAYRQAARADVELDAGAWRGPLHGVPWGAKDLLAVRGYPTTWGATPFRDQVIDENAAVVERLEHAGAVLIAKLTLGALAWGDVWFGGQTRNPWNLEQGSSGSSAGSGAAVAAGLVPFAIGSETLGSIVSPSTRNGVTGHRPTYGLVSRYGAMTLSWSLDKLGPMARSALDCALVFEAIRGADPRDGSSVDAPFPFVADQQVRELRVGYLQDAFEADYVNRAADAATLDTLRSLGVTLEPIRLPTELPIDAMMTTLGVEAAAAFDDLTRSGGVDTLVRQGPGTWPHEFRLARFVPAVEFFQGARARMQLMRQMAETVGDLDVFVSPSFGGGTLRITNLTGHPCVCVPNALHPLEDEPDSERRRPGSITFVGGLYKDAHMLALACAYQRVTDFHMQRPPIV